MAAKTASFFSQVSWPEPGKVPTGRAFESAFQAQQLQLCLELTAPLEPGLGFWGHHASRDANLATSWAVTKLQTLF